MRITKARFKQILKEEVESYLYQKEGRFIIEESLLETDLEEEKSTRADLNRAIKNDQEENEENQLEQSDVYLDENDDVKEDALFAKGGEHQKIKPKSRNGRIIPSIKK
jgi:hypothetical protein